MLGPDHRQTGGRPTGDSTAEPPGTFAAEPRSTEAAHAFPVDFDRDRRAELAVVPGLGGRMVSALLDGLLVWVLAFSLGYKLARPHAYISALRRYTALAALGRRQSCLLAWLTAAGEAGTITCLLIPRLLTLGAGLAGAQFLCYSLVIVMDRREHIADCGCWGLKIVSTRTGLLVRNGALFLTVVALLMAHTIAPDSATRNTIAALLLTVPFALLLVEAPTLLRVMTNK